MAFELTYDARRNTLTPAARAERLRAELRAVAQEQMADLQAAMQDVLATARAIAEGGEAYPHGARELCRNLASDVHAQSQTLTVITGRH